MKTRYYILDEISMQFQCNELNEPIWYEDKEQVKVCAEDWSDHYQIIEIPFN